MLKKTIVVVNCIGLLLLFLNKRIAAQITADFSSNISEACELTEASFTDLSTSDSGTITEWLWQIEGIQSTEQNPKFLLNQVGNYEVCLTVTNNLGESDMTCKTDFIIIHPNPIVSFEYTQDQSCSPSSVSFNENSTSQIVEWVWGIGGSSNIINTLDPNLPIQTTYNIGGSYTISLLVTDVNGCTDILTEENLINVDQSPVLDVSTNIPEACQLPVNVSFQNHNPESNANYIWDLGQLGTFNLDEPDPIEFSQDGTFPFSVTAQNEKCMSSFFDTINIATNPEFSFSYPQSKCADNSFFFVNNSGIPYDSIEWRSDNGDTFKSLDNALVVLSEPGCIGFTASIFINNCTFEYQLPECITIIEKPELDFDIEIEDPCSLPSKIFLNADITGDQKISWKISNGDITLNSDSQIDSFQIFTPGIYEVEITLDEADDCRFSYSHPDLIIDEIDVQFPVDFLGGCAPRMHTLQAEVNASSPVSYLWTIPDLNIVDTSETIQITLADTSAHLVNLVIENAAGCRDTIEQDNYIAAGISPVTGMTLTQDSVCAGGPFGALDQSSPFATEWFWTTVITNEDWSEGMNIELEFRDTGFFDIIHTSAHYGCPGDTIIQEDVVHVSGPIAIVDIEQNCGAPQISVNSSFIDTDHFEWTIELDEGNFVTELDSFDFEFPGPGDYTLNIVASNDSNGCVENRNIPINVSDQVFFEIDTTRGCVPLEINVNYDPQFFESFRAPEAEILGSDPGFAQLRYNTSGEFPSPFISRNLNDICIDTISYDIIFVNEVDARFSTVRNFCAPELHPIINTSTSLFGNIEQVQWDIDEGFFTSSDFDISVQIEDDRIYSIKLVVEDSWSCVDSIFRPNGLLPVLLIPEFESDTIGCTEAALSFNNTTSTDLSVSTRWDFGDGTFIENSNLVEHVFTDEGSFEVCLTISTNIGCEKTTCKEIVISNPIANFIADPTSTDCPPLLSSFENTSLSANQYLWDFGDNSGTSDLENPSHIYNEVNNFDVRLIASQNGMCADTLLVEDLINILGPRGDWDLEILNECIPLEVSFNGNSDDDYKFTWDFGNGELSSPSNPQNSDNLVFTYDEPGLFKPILLLDNGEGCVVSIDGDSILVNDIQLDLDFSDGIFCASPGTIDLSNLSTSSDPNASYSWTISGQDGMQFSNELDPSFEIFNPGEIEIKLLGQTDNCRDSLIIEDIIVIDGIQINAPSDTICYNETFSLKGSGTAMNYTWTDLGGNVLSTADTLSLTLVEDENFWFIGSRPGCPDVMDMSTVSVADQISIELETEYVSYDNLSVQFEVAFDGNLGFEWSPANGLSCTNCPRPLMRPDSTTNYQIKITDLDTGCSIDTSIVVRHIDQCTAEGILTPNIMRAGHDQNNRAQIFFENEEEFINLSIFDRWGNKMFFTDDLSASWDGTYKDQFVDIGVYAIMINAICSTTNEPYIIHRDITVVR